MVLLVCIIIAAIFGAIMLCAGSIAFVTVFGDAIVAGLIIGLIIKHFVKKKKN